MSYGVTLSNGELHVELNEAALVENLYFPYVGYEAHTHDASHKIGIYIDGAISWLGDLGWRIKTRLPHGALIADTIAVNDELGILLEFDDFVASDDDAFIRNVHIVNLRAHARSMKIFFHQAFTITGGGQTLDTGVYVPESSALLHYRGRRAFVAGGVDTMGDVFDQFSVGEFGEPGLEGTWRDAEDGELAGNQLGSGLVDSVMRFAIELPIHASTRVQYWIVAGTSVKTALTIHDKLRMGSWSSHMTKTASHWHKWLAPGFKLAQKIEPTKRQVFINSLLRLRAQVDAHGSVITEFTGKGAYKTCRIEDAAYSLWPLIRIGYREEALRFFTFCRQAMTEDGQLLDTYRADGAWDPMAEPFPSVINSTNVNASATVLFIFSQYHELHPRSGVLDAFYDTMVVPMASFVANSVDESTHLAINGSTYSCALIYASLQAAADLADKRDDQDHSVMWRSTSQDLYEASTALYDKEAGVVIASVDDNSMSVDAFFGVFMLGLIGLSRQQLIRAAAALNALKDVDGLYKESPSDHSPSIVASLRVAQFYIDIDETSTADEIINNVSAYISKTGELRASPSTGTQEASVWASAEYVSALLDGITKA